MQHQNRSTRRAMKVSIAELPIEGAAYKQSDRTDLLNYRTRSIRHAFRARDREYSKHERVESEKVCPKFLEWRSTALLCCPALRRCAASFEIDRPTTDIRVCRRVSQAPLLREQARSLTFISSCCCCSTASLEPENCSRPGREWLVGHRLIRFCCAFVCVCARMRV